jgi:hypothetical protein
MPRRRRRIRTSDSLPERVWRRVDRGEGDVGTGRKEIALPRFRADTAREREWTSMW